MRMLFVRRSRRTSSCARGDWFPSAERASSRLREARWNDARCAPRAESGERRAVVVVARCSRPG